MFKSERTIITNEDVKNIVDSIFNDRENGMEISLVDGNMTTKTNIVDYLDMEFYNFRDRLESTNFDDSDLMESWINSLPNEQKTYGLVQIVDSSVTASQDIDNGDFMTQVTFLCPIAKFVNLEYYAAYLRNNFIGVPQEILNADGKKIKVFVLIGNLTYDDNGIVADSPMGECIVCQLGISIMYLANAETSYDYTVELAIGGEYNELGELNAGAKLLTLPITKQTHQLVGAMNILPMANAPQFTGGICTAFTRQMTFSFYDYNEELSKEINKLFWGIGAIGSGKQTNFPIALQIKIGEDTYKYNCVLKEMEKVIPNGDFTISSMTLITKAN